MRLTRAVSFTGNFFGARLAQGGLLASNKPKHKKTGGRTCEQTENICTFGMVGTG